MFGIDRRVWAIIAILLLLSFVGGMKYADMRTEQQQEPLMILSDNQSNLDTDQMELSEEMTMIQVYVTGEVANPGVYTLESGARVYDALSMAGGALDGADFRYLPMARVLQDEETILIPAQGEVSSSGQAMVISAIADSNTININTASAGELAEKLPGIGPTLAQRIVDYRSQNGPFRQIEDIKKVNGIGDKRFAELKGSICVK